MHDSVLKLDLGAWRILDTFVYSNENTNLCPIAEDLCSYNQASEERC